MKKALKLWAVMFIKSKAVAIIDYIYILQEYIPQKVKYHNYNSTNPINILAYRIYSIYIYIPYMFLL